jgi:hypothetical protein
MSPNAMANQRAVTITQLKALRSATQQRLRTLDAARDHLSKSVAQIDAIGKIPALNDVHKIGAAIRHLAMAQIVQADLNRESLVAEDKTLDDAITQSESAILRVGING